MEGACPIMPESTTLITLPAAAELLGVDPVTIRRYASRGRLTLYRIGPRMLRVDRGEVLSLVERVSTTNPAA